MGNCCHSRCCWKIRVSSPVLSRMITPIPGSHSIKWVSWALNLLDIFGFFWIFFGGTWPPKKKEERRRRRRKKAEEKKEEDEEENKEEDEEEEKYQNKITQLLTQHEIKSRNLCLLMTLLTTLEFCCFYTISNRRLKFLGKMPN